MLAIERIHTPVLCDRVVTLLGPALESAARPVFVDGTLGMGGHSEALLEIFPQARSIGIDRDPAALALARQRLERFGSRMTFVQGNYDQIAQVTGGNLTAILLDLGLSSLQIDSPERGFAYAVDAPLDMRMSPDSGMSAADLLNTISEADLIHILRKYGDEPNAPRIARAIIAHRESEPFSTSAALVAVIIQATPMALRNRGGHPAKRTFQALRIVVNGELDSLERALPAALEMLSPSGRMAVLAYHSGEDRLVKKAFATAVTDRVPLRLPQVPVGLGATHRLITKGAEKASASEIQQNPRAASVRLRVIERCEVA